MKSFAIDHHLKTIVATALLASLLAGAGILLVFSVLGHATPGHMLRNIAMVITNDSKLDASRALVLGTLVHFVVSFGWSLGYVYLALRTPQLLQAPFISGLCYGIVVEMFMDGILVSIGGFHLPTPSAFSRDVLAHAIGFGLPLAYVTSKRLNQQKRFVDNA